MEHSKDLQKAAQKWADHLAKQDKPENSSEQDQGECLFSYRRVIKTQLRRKSVMDHNYGP